MKHFVNIKILFSIYLIFGIILTPDYGIGWDDYYMRDNAERNIQWAVGFFQGDRHLKDEIFRDNVDEHGPAFQFVLLAAEKLIDPDNLNEANLLRHYISFTVFAFLSLLFYRLLRTAGFSKSFSLLGWIALVLYPRIFAHSIFNTKDPILLILFVSAVYFLFMAIHRKKLKWHILFGIVSGLIIDIRIIGLMLLAPYLVSLLLNWQRSELIKLLVGLFVTVTTVILFWPYLWDQPIHLFMNQFKVITQVKQPNPTFFNGEFYLPKHAPRSYLPYFLFITIPLFIWIGIAVGVFIHLKKILSDWRNSLVNHSLFWISLFVVTVPVLAAVVLRPVFYNGWRHFQFIYPFLLILAMYGAKPLINRSKFRIKVLPSNLIIAVIFLAVIAYNSFLSPHGHLYFNLWVGKDLEQRFEGDYWGIGFKKAWEFLDQNVPNPANPARVMVSDKPGLLNYQLLPERARSKFILFDSLEHADYLITNHHHFQKLSSQEWHPYYFGEKRQQLGEEIYRSGTSQTTAIRIYRLK